MRQPASKRLAHDLRPAFVALELGEGALEREVSNIRRLGASATVPEYDLLAIVDDRLGLLTAGRDRPEMGSGRSR